MQFSFSVADLAAIAQPSAIRGTTSLPIRSVASLGAAVAGDLSFLSNAKYKQQVFASKASVVLVPADFAGEPAPDQVFLLVDNPSLVLLKLCAQVEATVWPRPAAGVHPTAVIDPSARIAASATVGPLCVIEAGASVGERAHLQAQVFVGRNAVIGEGSWLMPGCRVATECTLGRRVRLQPGAVIGGDGFGYELVKGRYERIPQIGNVVLGDDVEIGSNTTIDRARFSTTTIGEGTKIDNLVQIGHNVVIGRHCIICAQTGISGSTTLGDYCVFGGQVGVAGHLTIGNQVQVGAQAGIGKDIENGKKLWGTTAIEYALEMRLQVLRPKIPELFKRVSEIEARLK